MLLPAGERQHFARLLRILMFGEHLAERCARRQAQIATDPALQRFFLAQARQEKFHALVFHHSALWLAPKGTVHPPSFAPLQQYEALLEEALHRRDLAETLLAQQVMIDGLGEVILRRLDTAMTRHGWGLTRLRRLLLNQEQAHHHFGLRQLERCVANDVTAQDRLQRRAPAYLALIEQMLEDFQDAFAFFDENLGEFLHDVQRDLPTWIRDA